MKKILIFLAAGFILAALYFIEISKIELRDAGVMPTLDDVSADKDTQLWDSFFKVRADLIDGNRATFSIPDNLRELDGDPIRLKGAIEFRTEGSRWAGENHVAVSCFEILPLLSMTYCKDVLPDVEMRYTIIVNLKDEWTLSREDMIRAEALVEGRFRIDTSNPYYAAFFIDDAVVELVE